MKVISNKPTIGGYKVKAVDGIHSVYAYRDNYGKVVYVSRKATADEDTLYNFRLVYKPEGRVVLPDNMRPFQPCCIATGLPVKYNIAYTLLDSFLYEWLKPLHDIAYFSGAGRIGKVECANGAYHWEVADDEEGEEERFIPIPTRFRLTNKGIVVYGDGYESGIILPWGDYPIPVAHLSDSKYTFDAKHSITHNINRVVSK
jgi:hypothetical protein